MNNIDPKYRQRMCEKFIDTIYDDKRGGYICNLNCPYGNKLQKGYCRTQLLVSEEQDPEFTKNMGKLRGDIIRRQLIFLLEED
ncbi:MAG: hypothetical protein QXI33_02560 [Candidatus Pacearchaeota archaeon]